MEEHPINAPKNAAGPLPDLLLLLPKRPCLGGSLGAVLKDC